MTRNLSHCRDFTEETWRALADENWLGRHTSGRMPLDGVELPDNTVEVVLHDDGTVTIRLLPHGVAIVEMSRRAETVDEAFRRLGQ